MATETVLITGCSSGIGRATARAFLEDDWVVYATSRDEADLEGLADSGAKTDTLDVTVGDDIDRVVTRMMEEDGRIDCLVNNAGYGQYGPVEDVPTDTLHEQFDVNVYGPHRLTRAVLPHMRDQEEGTIVNVSSIYGRLSTPAAGAYAGSKHALEAMTDALRNEVDAFGVDVVLVEPGAVDTSFTERVDDELGAGLHRQETVYGWIYDLLEDATVLGGQFPGGSQPEDVATVIIDAANVTDANARYTVGRYTDLFLKTNLLPDWLRDFGFRVARKIL